LTNQNSQAAMLLSIPLIWQEHICSALFCTIFMVQQCYWKFKNDFFWANAEYACGFCCVTHLYVQIVNRK